MVIQFKYTKKHIEIMGSTLIPTKYKCALIKELNRVFELKNSEDITIKDDLLVNEIAEQDVNNYMDCYKEGNFKCSFEAFLELVSFAISSLKICVRGSNIHIATIDFEPDGDIDTIWIDVLDSKYLQKLVNVVRRVNT